MRPDTARLSFFVRLYEWALGDVQKDVEHGYPILSAFECYSRPIQCALHWLRSMPLERQKAVCRAKVRFAFAKEVLPLMGEVLSEEEQKLSVEADTKYHFYNKEGVLPPLTVTNPLLDPNNPARSLDKCMLSRAIAQRLEAKDRVVRKVTRNETELEGRASAEWFWVLTIENHNPFRGRYTLVQPRLTCSRPDIPFAGAGFRHLH